MALFSIGLFKLSKIQSLIEMIRKVYIYIFIRINLKMINLSLTKFFGDLSRFYRKNSRVLLNEIQEEY